MEFSVNKLKKKAQQLVSLFRIPNEELTYLYDFLKKQNCGSGDVEFLLRCLSRSLTNETLTIQIATTFQDCLLLLITNALEDNDIGYQWKCIALSKLMHLSLCVKRYALSYFSNRPSPFSTSHHEILSKKSKTLLNKNPDNLAVVKCCFYLLKSDTSFFKELWNWSEFLLCYVDQSNSESTILSVYVNHIIAMLTNMNTAAIRKLNEKIPEELLIEFFEEQESVGLLNLPRLIENDTVTLPEDNISISGNSAMFVTNIEGVLLPIFNRENCEFFRKSEDEQESIIRVESTRRNLRSIALGVTSGRAICLSGPVGCGKTTLVEYLAQYTGRVAPKKRYAKDQLNYEFEQEQNKLMEIINTNYIGNKRKILPSEEKTITPANGFLRIQLGDQTDSKMLLGQYHCTDVPGEFIWLPGVLTQAVINGYWLLLEDLDCATTDTFTVLSNLLENNYLSVPGMHDCVKVTPGFQLFVTVRTHKSSSSNWSQKALFSLLEKHLFPINILPLSRNELCDVIRRKYSKLATVANRIADVFLAFSSGAHNVADNLRQQESSEMGNVSDSFLQLPYEEVSLSSIIKSGRLVSTRDLIKLCERSNQTFSVTSTECAYFVFQNAVDIFCSYLPNSKEKTKLIVGIGAKLGIIQSRCEYLAEELKPEIYIDCERIKVGRAVLYIRSISPIDEKYMTPMNDLSAEEQSLKKLKLSNGCEKIVRHYSSKRYTSTTTFSFTRLASCLLERIAVCVANAEPVLLVGETGVGKTSSVQYLAAKTKHKLVVVNMNNQSDVSDLVGGFKPVDLAYVMGPMRTEFEYLFRNTFSQVKNESFLTKFSICYNQGNFSVIVKLMIRIVCNVYEKFERNELREKDLLLLPRWMSLKIKLQKLNSQLSKSVNISFAFIPGSLVNCIKNGDWVLLDEINLASAETLECLSTILEPDGSVILLEKGDFAPVKRHSDFRIFSCMNPNTDIGKKDLPVGIRNRFTEFFVDEAETDADLSLLVSDYLSATGIQRKRVMNIVKLYKRLKSLAKLELNDGLGNRPVFSLRTLCRSLTICAKNLCGSIERNLYESFCLSFLTQLDSQSHNVVQHLIKEALLSNAKAVLQQAIPKPGETYLNFEGYWIERGPKELQECSSYILTETVKENLKDLARIISIGKLPILLQGPTSAGKTSLIDYVARRSGNQCLRINNHEHTDLQEYIGSYTTDVIGKLVFREGILVQAMRHGYWIILDELNLASTEILEALNRVLDDNREIFIPETQTVVKAHENFMLFATQNPPGLYGGRKALSRAFKNRFIELHFSDIPRNELETILEMKCRIPASYARKMVACMVDLQKNRKTTSKNTFTLRDLFRWGIRYTWADEKLLGDPKYDWNQHLVEEGFLVLSARVRTEIELKIIHETLYKNFRKQVNLNRLYDTSGEEKSLVTKCILDEIKNYKSRTDIVWTRNMTRMAVLTAKALQFDEPVLLVGPTGCGKTTVCQLLASIRGVDLRILNCHMHTEGADFLGGLRPCRSRTKDEHSQKIFEWADGPLIQSMQEGSYFMADEISLAEDSVLERLNCILEPERTVLLAEKCGIISDSKLSEGIAEEFMIKAATGFQFLATMNPGGDFGKKELSPALRNRFTEIWCQPSDSKEDLIEIANNCIIRNFIIMNFSIDKTEILKLATYIVDIVFFVKKSINKFKFSIRDILAMANYIVTNTSLSFSEKAIFGLETIFLDALEMSCHETFEKLEVLKTQICEYAMYQADKILGEKFTLSDVVKKRGIAVQLTADNRFGIKPFYIKTNTENNAAVLNTRSSFLFEAPTTKHNLFRLLSALSLNKPILLEGPPGVGKTSIVESLSQAIGYNIVRINLCEHTDLADLFGTDLPAEDNISSLKCEEDTNSENLQIGSFQWRDGPLLAALKASNTWILLDELNLAPQSVLEGLNAILDHRGEVFIPELNKTFALNKQTRIFASQNPLKQGGGRKGLPQSFLNRFTKVYVRKLSTEDLLYVVEGKYKNHFDNIRDGFIKLIHSEERDSNNLFDMYKSIKQKQEKISGKGVHSDIHNMSFPEFDLSLRLVRFSELLDKGISSLEFGYKGGPFEINLRDILLWCELMINPETGFVIKHEGFLRNFDNFLLILYERMKLVYYQRMRCDQDKQFIRNAFQSVFQCDADYLNSISEDVALYWTNGKIYFNDIVLNRDIQPLHFQKPLEFTPLLLESQREVIKTLIECVHIEKPILLCGSADTGKTKIVDSLCYISNQMCNLDNIDDSVTGSFQQIDLNRHLEDMSFKVECIYLKFIQSTILNSTSTIKVVAALLDSWNTYSVLRNYKCEESQGKSLVSGELVNYRRRIDKLNNVIDVLKEYQQCTTNGDHIEELQFIKNKLNILKLHVKNTNSLNTGGYFEWVDSKIVKSLKEGEYILLEHVNLCSSAVLDRLNPVFEPSGSLMLSEKGIIENENAEIVKKAGNFRAFLTLDPKNGELSRAMRNRCVELYMNKRTPTLDDKRIIVFHQGVHNVNAINCIISIHDNIVKLTEVNNLTISHLTKSAFLCASYVRIGYDMERAIYVSAMEVYVYSASTDLMGYGLDFYQNKLREIVISKMEKFNSLKCESRRDYLKEAVLKCCSLSEIPLVNLQILPLKVILDNLSEPNQIQESLSFVFSGFQKIIMKDINFNEFSKYLIYMAYENSSLNDLRLRYLLLERCLKFNSELLELSKSLYNCVASFESKNVDPSLPWNTKMFPRIRDYKMETLENHALCLSSSLIINMLVSEIPQQNLTKMSTINVLAYSQAVAKQVIIDKLNNPFLERFSDFLFHLRKAIKSNMNLAQLNLVSYVEVITAIQWFNRILNVSESNLYLNKELNTDLIDKLLLHFKWLDKYLMRLIHKVLPNISPELRDCHRQLLAYVKTIKYPLNVRRKMYAKHLLEFQPFSQELQVTVFMKMQDLEQLLRVIPLYGNFAPEDVIKKFILRKNQSTRKAYAIISKYYRIIDLKKIGDITLNRDLENVVPNSLKFELEQFLTSLPENTKNDMQISQHDMDVLEFELNIVAGLLTTNTSSSDSNMLHEIELSMLAVNDYFLIKQLVASVENSAVKWEVISYEYQTEMSFLNETIISLVNICQLPYYGKYRDFCFGLNKYINRIDSFEEFEKLLLYLGGGYKHLSALSRRISTLVQKLQMESLSTHPECLLILASKDNLRSEKTYEGPPFIHIMTQLLCVSDSGAFRPVPLCDLSMWRNSLSLLCDTLWHNSMLISPAYSIQWNNYIRALQNAKRLLVEVKYVEQLSANEADESLAQYTKCFQKLVSKLQDSVTNCDGKITENQDATANQLVVYNTSLINILIGCIELCLIPFTPLIDPVEKNRLKNKYLADDIDCFNNLKFAYDFQRISMKYKNLGKEIYEALDENINLLSEKQNKLKEKVALRPEQCLYSSLIKDIIHFLTTNCDPQVLLKLINNIESTWNVLHKNTNSSCSNTIFESCSEIISKLNLWIENSQCFIHHTLKPYSLYYQDFLQPLQCSIQELRFGFEGTKLVLFQIKNSLIEEGDGVYININANNRLHTALKNIAQFPSNKMLNIFNVSSSTDILKNRCPVFSILNKMSGSESDYFHLLKAKVMELKNRVVITQLINQELFAEFDFAFNIINQVWQREEEIRRQKQKEDESLYLTKTKCAEEDDEVQELKEIEEIFPTNVHEDFGDFIQEDTLERVIKLDAEKQNKAKKASVIVQENDYSFIAKNFIEFLVKNSKTYYHAKPKYSDSTDYLQLVDYFQQRFQVFIRIYNKYKSSVNDWLDEECFSSFCFSAAIQKNLLADNASSGLKKTNAYNFYKDANIPEIVSCTDVLHSIKKRVREQLELYPEHATLIDIEKIIKRIKSLPTTAPVVRFSAGFQILRQHVALWNEVAHKNNNLKAEEQEIAQFVQNWTRMELQFWRNSLTLTREKVESIAYRYWFFIYNLIHEFIAEREIDFSLANINSTTKRFEQHEIVEPVDPKAKKFTVKTKDVINILRQFIESSCYGDFHVRMQLLLAFELYLHNFVNYSAKDANATSSIEIMDLIAGLRNLQLYFEQFSEEIEQYKNSIKTPIEKKLKELVKIESYNKDLSYISMRNNVARVHRNLNKFLKEFERGLKEKISAILQPKDSTSKDYNFANDKGYYYLRFQTKMKYYKVNPKSFVLVTKHKNDVPADNKLSTDTSHSLLSKVQRLLNTSRNVVKETLTNIQYPELIIALDTFLAQQLERCDYLRNLTVDRTKERTKQKLEAKQILQQKRKALTDVFKALSTLGVSYKSGLMELSMNDEVEDIFLPPFCIKTMLLNANGKRLQPILMQLNENLDLYFNKCVFKLKLLRNIMLTPLSELGPPNIERIKGYAIDFFTLVQNQRRLLAYTTKNINDYGFILQQLRDLDDLNSKTGLDKSYMNFNKFCNQYDVLRGVIVRIRYVFEQLKLYFLHVPSNKVDGECTNKSPIEPSAIIAYCEKILSLSKTTLNNLNSDSSDFISIERLNEHKTSCSHLHSLIEDVLKNFKTCNNEYLPIAKPVLDLSIYVNDTMVEVFNDTTATCASSDCSFKNIDLELEAVIHSLLLSLQKLYKKYQTRTQLDEEEKLQTKNKHDKDELEDQHLKNKLYGALKEDWNLMEIEKINKQLMNILLKIKLSEPSVEKIGQIQKLLSIQPLLEQFSLLSEYFLYQQLGAHKVAVKMLSVILTVFVEIGMKGFCVPQDLLQDEEGKTEKDQKSGEGFGLEDGTGENDVSDKIESEDQLDDAKRPEDRKQDNNKDEPNDCQEQKGIEMSDNFEGEMQEKEKQNDEEDDSGESENEEDISKEMGETEEGADKLDDQIWGDDETPDDQDEEQDMDEEDGKGSNEQQDAHNDLNSNKNSSKDEDGQENLEKDGLDATNEPNNEDKRKQKEKDINDVLEEEGDQDQENPYHNQLEDPQEPEDFNLEDLNVNEEDDEDKTQQNDDNPFDIDTMKENMQDVDDTKENQNENEDKEGNKSNDDISDDSYDSDFNDEDVGELQNGKDVTDEENPVDEKANDAEEQKRSHNEDEISIEEENENRIEKHEDYEHSKDQPMKEDNIQSIPENEPKGSKDHTENETTDNNVHQEQNMDDQDTGEEKEGVGQAQNEKNEGGHLGIAETKEPMTSEDNSSDTHTKEKRKQGRTDEDRSMGKADQNKIKRLKTIDKLNEEDMMQKEEDEELENNEMQADEYQHVKEPKTSDRVTLDNATEEQSKKIKPQSEEETIIDNEDELTDENQPQLYEETKEEEQNDNTKLQQIQAEKLDKKFEKPSKFDNKCENTTSEEQLKVEGEIVETKTASRNDDTTSHCNTELLADKSGNVDELSAARTLELKKIYQDQVNQQQPIIAQNEDHETWNAISNRMAQNARDLCEQLRLILEPTKCTRLKGDYRTGRRINMKKIIPYIASQFRKDKIWLRRTKPAQRDYKITIAIDDSKSMHHNNSKVLTLEAISLVSQSLTLLESGRLSIISFGERPQILLNHSEQFDGPKLVTSLQFSQDKTNIAELLDFIRTVNTEEGSLSSENGIFENLLLILSDGRNIFGEGKSKVKNAIKLARLQRIFMVYIIIDNPENKDSILDIQTLEMLPNNSINIKSYLEDFPFPYYIIVRDLNQLPVVLSEAMRQWFELVNSEQ